MVPGLGEGHLAGPLVEVPGAVSNNTALYRCRRGNVLGRGLLQAGDVGNGPTGSRTEEMEDAMTSTVTSWRHHNTTPGTTRRLLQAQTGKGLMTPMVRRLLGVLAGVGVAALLTGGVASASVPNATANAPTAKTTIIHGCVSNSNHQLKVPSRPSRPSHPPRWACLESVVTS